jgi:1-aminocyclopropane-1-carboxylate deaminase/D-cysteine desulfhydrase-like pyridoxal-dependent ACC family enzyme
MIENTLIQEISDPLIKKRGITAAVLRLDLLHPVVSGNKIFKLKYYIEKALNLKKEEIVSFGGAHSNHLVATAFVAKENGLKSIGYVRGERPSQLSDTLKDCEQYGMELKFTQREKFDDLQINCAESNKPESLIVPYGGYGRTGALGAKEILSFKEAVEYNIIMASTGSGTMGAGLILSLQKHQQLILVSALKNNYTIENEIKKLLFELEIAQKSFQLNYDFHFGGYAKKNADLLQFMNTFYQAHKIPTDIVYTGKLAYAFDKMLLNNQFPEGSKVLLVHSGGLQGNRSLKNKELIF